MIITVATFTEAKSLIEALELKAITHKPFSIYQNATIRLIITGIGPINAAAALGHIVTQPTQILNVGICAGQTVGSIYNIYKVIDDASAKSYILQKDSFLPNATIRTLHYSSQKSYKELVDMEASALAAISKRLSSPIKIVKIVSDNYDPKSVTPNVVSELMKEKIDILLDIIANLKKDHA